MALITPNQPFLHGATRYEADVEYEVSDEESYYFRAHGWVHGGIPVPPGADVTLDIEPATHGHEAEEPGNG